MSCLKTKHIYQSFNNTIPTKKIISPNACNIDNSNNSDLSYNLQKYITEPLKEALLLINLITISGNTEDNLSLLNEIKNFIKITLNNCNKF